MISFVFAALSPAPECLGADLALLPVYPQYPAPCRARGRPQEVFVEVTGITTVNKTKFLLSGAYILAGKTMQTDKNKK